MPNEDEMLAGAGLPPWFAVWVRSLVGTIRLASQPGSAGTAAQNAAAHLATIRANAAERTPGLYDAVDMVRSSVRALESIVARPAALVEDHPKLIADAREVAIGSLALLVEVLRSAEPSAKARALY